MTTEIKIVPDTPEGASAWELVKEIEAVIRSWDEGEMNRAELSGKLFELVLSHKEDRFARVLAVFREYLLDLDHDIEGCSGPELDEIDKHHEATLELRRRVVAHVAEGADARGQRPAQEPGPFFYIQDARSYAGDTVIWWRPEGKGYTTVLGDAGLYTAKEASGLRETDRPVPMQVARRAARITVSSGDLEASLAREKKG